MIVHCRHGIDVSDSNWHLCPTCSQEGMKAHLRGTYSMDPAEVIDSPVEEELLSEVTDTLDQLVERASIPNLGALFRKGKEAGLIKAGHEYSAPVPGAAAPNANAFNVAATPRQAGKNYQASVHNP